MAPSSPVGPSVHPLSSWGSSVFLLLGFPGAVLQSPPKSASAIGSLCVQRTAAGPCGGGGGLFEVQQGWLLGKPFLSRLLSPCFVPG